MAERNIFLVDSPFNSFRVGRAGLHAFTKGEMLGYGSDDGLIKPMSASHAMVGAGRCEETKTVSTSGQFIEFAVGVLILSNSSNNAVDSTDEGRICYGDASNSHFAVGDSAGTNPLMGRVVEHNAQNVRGARVGDVAVHVNHSLFASGTLI